jgi:hypothetical protein
MQRDLISLLTPHQIFPLMIDDKKMSVVSSVVSLYSLVGRALA